MTTEECIKLNYNFQQMLLNQQRTIIEQQKFIEELQNQLSYYNNLLFGDITKGEGSE